MTNFSSRHILIILKPNPLYFQCIYKHSPKSLQIYFSQKLTRYHFCFSLRFFTDFENSQMLWIQHSPNPFLCFDLLDFQRVKEVQTWNDFYSLTHKLFYQKHQPFQIAAFGVEKINRVVGGLRELVQHPHLPPHFEGC